MGVLNALSLCFSVKLLISPYTKKRRGKKETEVARRLKVGFKRRETDSASNHFPKCSPQSGTPKEIHRIGWRREGGGRRCNPGSCASIGKVVSSSVLFKVFSVFDLLQFEYDMLGIEVFWHLSCLVYS